MGSFTTIVESESSNWLELGEDGGEGVVASGICKKAEKEGYDIVRETGTKERRGERALEGLVGD